MSKDTFESLPLSTRVLCSRAVCKNDNVKEMLVNYYNILDEAEKESFNEYAQAFRQVNKQMSKNKFKIDKTAIIIATRLKEELNMPCFPVIKKQFKIFLDAHNGSYPWSIVLLEKGEHIKRLYGVTRVSVLTKAKNKLFAYSHKKKTIIDIE